MTRLEEIVDRFTVFEHDSDVDWLLRRVRELEAVVRAAEYAEDFCDEPACPVCLHRSHVKHSPECALAAALKNLEEE